MSQKFTLYKYSKKILRLESHFFRLVLEQSKDEFTEILKALFFSFKFGLW